MDFQPFSVVEDPGFQEFVKTLNPSHEIPSRKVVSQNLIPTAYEKCKLAVVDLKNVDRICLTTDAWTLSVNEGYRAVTGHFISDEFVLKPVLLDCIQIKGSHTSDHLAHEIKKIFHFYKISDKDLVVVTDNASNMVSCVKMN
jgi:hypothetical protein